MAGLSCRRNRAGKKFRAGGQALPLGDTIPAMNYEAPARRNTPRTSPPRGAAWDVLWAFLKLGLTSFGGPVAHIGYFRSAFVTRRHWLDERSYSDLVALCQFLPGPSSSQVGIAIGMRRAGWLGALAAWVGFTLPSALALVLFAVGQARWPGLAQSGAVHGLKIVALAVVAQAVWGMAKTLCPDRQRAGVAVAAALVVLVAAPTWGSIAAMVLGSMVGRWVLRGNALPPTGHFNYGISTRTGTLLLALWGLLLLALPVLAYLTQSPLAAVVATFYRAGALVFGGGHVVLPLLQAGVVPAGWVSNDAFLAGYGAAQAVPGPLFTFAAYLGAAMPAPLGGWVGGLGLLLVIFAPAFLLVLGALPFWETWRQQARVQRTMAGIHAAVVGVLGAALYDPVWTSAVHSRADFGLALAAFALLVFARLSPVLVVLLTVVTAAVMW